MELDLRAYARTLFKRKWIVAAGLLVSIALGTLVTVNSPRVYQAKTTLFVGEQQFAFEEIGAQAFIRNITVGLLKTYVELIKTRSTAQRAVVDGGLDVTPAEVQAGLDATNIIDTQIITVTYRGTDPLRAQRIANAVSEAFASDLDALGSSDAEGEPVVDVTIVDRAIAPGAPISPNPVRNMTLATLMGILLGVGVAFLVDHLDVTVKHRDEIEALGLPVIGSIPRLDTKGEDVYLEKDTQGLASEAFRKLRTSIGFLNLEAPTRSILVTSSLSQEGKTTTALNLAAAYAMGGLRTVLVEADLRRPSLHRAFGMVGTRGLTTAIVGDVPLGEAIMHTQTRNLSVLVAGAIPPNPVELLGSDQMTDLLGRLERMFDIVIVDSPPLVPVADPAALAGRCDGVVIVARAGKTDRRRLVDSARVVERAGGRLLGVVLNFLRSGDTPYEYEYYYGYRAASGAPTAAGGGTT